jgi:hypothetical protein
LIISLAAIANIATISVFVLKLQTISLHSVDHRSRQLRFFDSQHRNCGDGGAQHWFAVHCVYGASKVHFPDYYTSKRTITTDSELDPTKTAEIEHVLRALSAVARKTRRAIRIRIPAFLSYWGDFYVDDAQDHLQPYAIVNALVLEEVGVDVVEPRYWVKADGARRIAKQLEHQEKTFKIGSGAAALHTLQSVAADLNEYADELIFSLDELLKLDSASIGAFAGEEGGFVDGIWRKTFVCEELTEPEINPTSGYQNNI